MKKKPHMCLLKALCLGLHIHTSKGNTPWLKIYTRFTNTWAENEIKASNWLRENIAICIFKIQSTKITEGNLVTNFSVLAGNQIKADNKTFHRQFVPFISIAANFTAAKNFNYSTSSQLPIVNIGF